MGPSHIVRMSNFSSDRAFSNSGHSSKKYLTVSAFPHLHSSFTLGSNLDLEKFKLQVPKRKRARMVCCRLVPTKNAGAADTSALSLDKWSNPTFSATVVNHLRCSRSFSALLINAREVESGIRGCPNTGLVAATAFAAFCAAVLAASFAGTPT